VGKTDQSDRMDIPVSAGVVPELTILGPKSSVTCVRLRRNRLNLQATLFTVGMRSITSSISPYSLAFSAAMKLSRSVCFSISSSG